MQPKEKMVHHNIPLRPWEVLGADVFQRFLFDPEVKLKETPHACKYATWAKGQPSTLVQSTIASMGTDSSDGLSNHTQSVDHCPANVIIESTSL